MQEFGDSLQIVAFTVDEVEYAFPINYVKEIIRHIPPQPTSAREPWMLGVINLRGSIVPIIDLGWRLGRDTPAHDLQHAKILVLEQDDVTIGAVVTSVDEVRTIDAEQVQPAPAGASNRFMDAVVTVDDRLIMLLDATALLSTEAVAA
jgi:purine-binding chemotaxis protein CheW